MSKADAILVLGAPLGEDGSPSRPMRRRVQTAVNLFKKGDYNGLILSGGTLGGLCSEAEAMAVIAIDEGLERNALSLETKARNTFENLSFSRDIMGVSGWRTVLVVSDDWHLRRAQYCAERLSMAATFYPVPTDLLPSPPLARLIAQFRETLAMIKYRALY